MSTDLVKPVAAARRVPPALIAGAVLGAALGAAFFAVRAQTAIAERRYPPRGKFIVVDGVRLHYLDEGTGPAIVLLHGNGVTADDFQVSGLFDRLAATHRVIAFDRPGFGYSARPDRQDWTPEAQAALLHQAMAKLGIAQPVVVGHSWGTLVALAMALDYPGDVRAIALLGGYYYPTLRIDAFVNSLANLPVAGTVWRHTFAPLLGRLMWRGMAKQLFAPADVPVRFGRMPPWIALRPSQLEAAAAENGLMVPAATRLSKRYGELAMPVALVAGHGDKLIPPEKNTGRLHRELAHSDLSMPGGAGHMVHYNRLDHVVDAILRL
jgi:pimeloyl-ACP methyl ester carboxylesterase